MASDWPIIGKRNSNERHCVITQPAKRCWMALLAGDLLSNLLTGDPLVVDDGIVDNRTPVDRQTTTKQKVVINNCCEQQRC